MVLKWMILVGFTQNDTSENIDYMVDKVLNLRIYDDEFNKKLKEYIHVETGIFGAEMKVELINDGPITIMLEK